MQITALYQYSWDCIVIENKCMIRLGWRAESAWVLSTFHSFMCKFQTYTYNIIQFKLAHLPFSEIEREIFWLQYSFTKWHWLLVSHFPKISPNLLHHFLRKLCVWSRLRASGQFCFSFFNWDEDFLCSCHTLPFLSAHHFILINVNLMR